MTSKHPVRLAAILASAAVIDPTLDCDRQLQSAVAGAMVETGATDERAVWLAIDQLVSLYDL